MTAITLDQNSPHNIFLAADGSFSPYSANHDPVWALHLNGADTQPFSLVTTFGLRAKSMRLIPNFLCDERRLVKTRDYACLPTVTSFTTASLQIECTLKNGLEIQFLFFIPEPALLTCHLQMANTSQDPLEIIPEIAALLIPMDHGRAMQPEALDGNQVLGGQAGDLLPVLFMNGGSVAVENPFPALRSPLLIPPRQSQSITWALAATSNVKTSFEAAKDTTAQNWRRSAQAQVMKNTQQTLKIQTGNPDWDACFLLSQTHAMTHLVTPQAGSGDSPILIRTRLPDQAPRIAQPGTPWDDLTTLEAVHLARVLLPARPELVAGLVEQFLSRVDARGRLPSRLNASPFRPSFQECPLLAGLSLEIYEITQDKSFLARVYPALYAWLMRWLIDPANPNTICLPTWEDPQQCQIDSGLFNFDIWEPTGRGLEIQTAESPALAAMLYHEIVAVMKIADILNITANQAQTNTLHRFLAKKIDQYWQKDLNCFAYLDKQSQLSSTRELIAEGLVQNLLAISRSFPEPKRLQVHLYSADFRTRVGIIQLHGKNAAGENLTETIRNANIRWIAGTAHLTSQNLFSHLQSISLTGFKPEDRFLIETADLTQPDITCLLPIWSGSATKKQRQALLKNILNPTSPNLRHGIPETWQSSRALPQNLPNKVNLLWNSFIIEGLERAGCHTEAMHLFSTLMTTVVKGLKDFHGFFSSYDSLSGKPCGQPNPIAGLVPIRLFLQIAGVKLFSPNKVAVWGNNPFPLPVTVQWQGLSLRREGEKTTILFPDGTHYEHHSEEPVVITTDGPCENTFN